MKMIWHYTTGLHARLIIGSGLLLPTAVFIRSWERPVCWFSSNQYWEQTANKGFCDKCGVVRTLSMEETFTKGLGLFRFGLPEERGVRWPEIGKKANIKADMRRALMEVGREVGANPTEWYGTLSAIPLAELEAQSLIFGTGWVSPVDLIPNLTAKQALPLFAIKRYRS